MEFSWWKRNMPLHLAGSQGRRKVWNSWGWDISNLTPLIDIGLTDLSKSVGEGGIIPSCPPRLQRIWIDVVCWFCLPQIQVWSFWHLKPIYFNIKPFSFCRLKGLCSSFALERFYFLSSKDQIFTAWHFAIYKIEEKQRGHP